MKKIKLIVLLTIVCAGLLAQEKGSHISFSVGGGLTGINYELLKNHHRNGVRDNQLGATATLDYTYYFNQHWGLSLGAGASYYRSCGMYEGTSREEFFSVATQMDNNFQNLSEYELRVRLMNWQEQQQLLTVDVPLMVKYQYKLGKTKRHGIFWGLGAKVQIPVIAKFGVQDADFSDMADENNWRLNVSAYYDNTKVELGHPDKQSVHHFGTITDPNASLGWESDMKLKLSWAAVGEVGALIGLSKRTDLSVGIYGEYGFNNIKKESKALIEAPDNYMASAEQIGQTLVYNGMVNSDRTEKVNLFSVGLKVGVKVKLGKLTNADDNFLEKEKKLEQWEKLPFMTKDTCCGGTDTKRVEDTLERIEALISELQKQGGIVCPSVVQDGLSDAQRGIVTERIYFELGDWKLREQDKGVLDQKAQMMKENRHLRMRILGNTCDIASDKTNVPLGLNRARTAKQYLVEKGIEPYRLVIATQSSYDPVMPNTTEQNRIQNRRCDFELIVE